VLSASKWKRQAEIYRRHDEVASKDVKHDSRHDDRDGAASNLAALINTIKAEGRANRAEERREDEAGKLREWFTIVLIALTLIAVGWQVSEMVKVYGPIKDQADAAKLSADAAKRSADAALAQAITSQKAAISNQRAWIGPRNAALNAGLEIGKVVEATINYENSGHEPGIGTVFDVGEFIAPSDADSQELIAQRLANAVSVCQQRQQWPGGSVVYPTNGISAASYQLFLKSIDDIVTPDLISGKDMIIVHGCFVYKTFDIPKHSYFCYYYRNGVSRPGIFNICPYGQYAD